MAATRLFRDIDGDLAGVGTPLIEDLRFGDLILEGRHYGEVRDVEPLPNGLVRVHYITGKAFSLKGGQRLSVQRKASPDA